MLLPFYCAAGVSPPFDAADTEPPFTVRQTRNFSARLLPCGRHAFFSRPLSHAMAQDILCLRRRRPFTTKVCVTFFLLFRRMTFFVCAPFGKAAKASSRKKASPRACLLWIYWRKRSLDAQDGLFALARGERGYDGGDGADEVECKQHQDHPQDGAALVHAVDLVDHLFKHQHTVVDM